jgi:general stress protein 26
MNSASLPTAEQVLSGETLAFLATIENNQPRLRPITVVNNQGHLYILTNTKSKKVQQIRANRNVELVSLVRHGGNAGYIRLIGFAIIVEDDAIRKRLAEETSFFRTYWSGSDDSDYTLIRINPRCVAYLQPGEEHEIILGQLKFH